jgi:hypothetical protein
VALNVIVTVLPDAGSNRWPPDATRSEKVVPLVLCWTERACVRASQWAGSFSTIRFTASDAPRSAWIHCGNTVFALSQ